jgi:hypothetical protein
MHTVGTIISKTTRWSKNLSRVTCFAFFELPLPQVCSEATEVARQIQRASSINIETNRLEFLAQIHNLLTTHCRPLISLVLIL